MLKTLSRLKRRDGNDADEVNPNQWLHKPVRAFLDSCQVRDGKHDLWEHLATSEFGRRFGSINRGKSSITSFSKFWV